MPVALFDFSADYDGERISLRKGIDYVAPGHELLRRFPARFGPEGRPERQSRDRGTTSRAPEPALDPSSFDVQRTARHEAAHAAAVYLLGWEPRYAAIYAGGDGECRFLPPAGLKGTLLWRQLVTISYVARCHAGWTAEGRGYGDDNKRAYEALRRLANGPGEIGRLAAELRQQAEQLAASPRFRWLAKWVAEELLERGRLDAQELGTLLLEADREYRRSRYA